MPAEGEVNVSTILQSLGNSLGDVIRRAGERLPNILFPQSAPVSQLPATQGPSFLATLFSPASWSIGHYLLIGGVVYYFMRRRR